MKKTAKDGVKRGKKRAANKKVAPAEAMTSDKNNPLENSNKPSRITANTLDKEHDIMVKRIANGRLPPIVPPGKVLPQKSNHIELYERHYGGENRKSIDSQGSGSLPVRGNTPPRASSPATRRRDENMTSYERMLQRETRRSRRKSVRSYTMLQSEKDEQDCPESVEESTLVVENEMQINQSNASLRTRSSVNHDPNHTLLQYFARLSSSPDVDDSLDLDHIQSLLQEGASVNTCDRFGQTLLHEVSRTWGTDVAQFFIEQGKYLMGIHIYGLHHRWPKLEM